MANLAQAGVQPRHPLAEVQTSDRSHGMDGHSRISHAKQSISASTHLSSSTRPETHDDHQASSTNGQCHGM